MIRGIVLALGILSSVGHAGQVVLSCDLAGLQGIADVEIKNTETGPRTNIHKANERNRYYSLPTGNQNINEFINLSQFPVLSDIPNAHILRKNGQWFFGSQGNMDQPINCAVLR